MVRRRKRLPVDPVTAQVEDLSHDGRGVVRVEGKAVFVDGALPGEEVSFIYTGRHRHYDEGRVERVLRPAADRVEPRCTSAAICGGCSLQHMAGEAQIAAKQSVLLDNLQRIGGVAPGQVLPALTGPLWGYRHKARLGVKYLHRKDRMLVGFREKRNSLVADIERCEVLHPAVGERLPALRGLINALSIRSAVPQIEVAVGDAAAALVFRVLEPPDETDLECLRAFGRDSGLHIYLQSQGPDSIELLWPQASTLVYEVDDPAIRIEFRPADFTQINPVINRRMIGRVLELLRPGAGDRVLDLFCGLGNFSLPLARRAGWVTGVEGEPGLVERARGNAARNRIDNAGFHAMDLAADISGAPWLAGGYNRVLLDPPRSGAQEVLPAVAGLGAQRIVYVSCHPGSLARDAGLLVGEHGYRLTMAGVMDMFPHTAHVESIAVFECQ